MTRPEPYCIVSHLDDVTKCFTCDSRREWTENNRISHRIDNIVSSFRERKLRWWQAENGKQEVYIQLDLEAEFHFTHLIMTFKTFRPKALLIERSFDFGRTWKIYRYFATNCAKSFPGVKRWPPRNLDDVICEQRYSDVAPSSEGEVIFRVLPPFIAIRDPYSKKVQDLLKLTNLRVNFTELHTLGDTFLDNRPEIKEKYYYAMYDMTVRGSCSCYGHASQCVAVPGYQDGYSSRADMVHGQCVCTHNTKGRNCELCQDFYNDLPWRPARQNQPNACKKCNCNGHSDQCRFDPAVFEASGRVSGGVCLNCQHNTLGKNCQQCIEFYYQDPLQDIRSFNICQPCDCDPSGSLKKGQCDDHTDEAYGLVAGRCHCKRFVEGKRCDRCKDGYWNLDENNPDGCEPCDCNILGTIANAGCDKQTGMCLCKRYVTGQRCDQCYPGFWGLGEELTGCRPCDCDVGGSVSEECDVNDGRCTCKPNIIGRQCDAPRPEYYFAKLDYLLYEAELAKGYGNTREYIREPYPDGYQSWTGPGFMQISEGDSLEFTINNIEFPMNYDIVIRYDPRMPDIWEDVRVYVNRDQQPDQNGPCANHRPSDDEKTAVMAPGSRFTEVPPSACLEPGVNYTIRVHFRQYKTDKRTPEATTLIDSIVLVPSTDSIPIFQGIGYPDYMRNEFIRYRCRESQLSVYQPSLVDFCRKLTFSISSSMMHRALPCECDPTGSLSSECEPAGGQCQCKPNVYGRRCDRCVPGTYNFGPEGCKPCNCHEYGARDNFCDAVTGQCQCINNVASRTCERCADGYYGFPQCRPCNCNGNADVCEDLTGRCIGCRDNTAGDYCERCSAGYYGDPRINVRIPCEPCMCPGGPDSPIQHADSCAVDPRSNTVTCECNLGYQGPNCDSCSDNYYGNPRDQNGTCIPCLCNNNIDLDARGNCDGTSGECLRCQYNTEGFNCEKCRPGYYGDATTQDCKECICFEYGTDQSAGHCNRENGQCNCLPNVVGTRCERCSPGFWNITSGEGCSDCGCDPSGSTSIECNQIDGQCDCIRYGNGEPARGGRDCASCPDLFWGDPTVQCVACDCNDQGSAQRQCDRRTGQCVCLPGISGYKCDRCDRGTTGELPNCKPCGECFDNWDRVVRDLRAQTQNLVEEALKIKSTGVEKAFEKEFRQMEDNIQEIRDILRNANISAADIRDIESDIERLRNTMNMSSSELERVENDLRDRRESIRQGNNDISALKVSVKRLQDKIAALRRNATDIQSQDVEGAFNLTREAQLQSRRAQQIVDGTDNIIQQSQNIRQDVDNMLTSRKDEFDRKLQENDKNLNEIDNQVTDLSSKIADLNELVCDGRGDPCDDVCGGAGCGVCGAEQSCDKGAVRKAENALDLARKAEDILALKEKNASGLYSQLQTAQTASMNAKTEAQMAYDEAKKAKNQTENANKMLQDLLNRISDFLTDQKAKPEDVKEIAEEVLSMRISLTPEQIIELADEINKTISGLQNIDDIITATSDDLVTGTETEREGREGRIKYELNSQKEFEKKYSHVHIAEAMSNLKRADGVLNNLKDATTAQDDAQRAIDQADTEIADAEQDLVQIESETAAAGDKTQQSRKVLEILRIKLGELRSQYFENERNVRNAEIAAEEAERLANISQEKANELTTKYSATSTELDSRYNMTSQAQARAKALKERADKIAIETTAKLKKLKEMEETFNENEMTLAAQSADIDELNERMAEYFKAIQDKARYYRDCKT
ncbi:hypothetical protein FSP39_018141 [Pinctada imbricata]|uniref:Laminin subunit beta-1 n=1 Tax=Pinctada imbricata TaxID=66713 RepID=A0AA88YNQ8_PINIB|nr:hypothetical protein FSP39_018141 [Pinctada imbricata]